MEGAGFLFFVFLRGLMDGVVTICLRWSKLGFGGAASVRLRW